MEQNDILELMRASDALLEGHFELRSGLHSARYFQCAQALRQPDVAEKLCTALARPLLAQLPAPCADAVVAPALGGLIVGHELARALKLPFIFVEKQNDKLALRRFAIRPGERYIVAEDVVTRGGRAWETIRIVRDCGAEVVGMAMLVDRSDGQVAFPCPVFSLLKMAPEAYPPDLCPLCRQGLPLTHPGS
jgi:orotate phosphoribosyltransferase